MSTNDEIRKAVEAGLEDSEIVESNETHAEIATKILKRLAPYLAPHPAQQGEDGELTLWLLLGGHDYEGEDIIACCDTEEEAKQIMAAGYDSRERPRYGFDSLRIQDWSVGERAPCVDQIVAAARSHSKQEGGA